MYIATRMEKQSNWMLEKLIFPADHQCMDKTNECTCYNMEEQN